jgi:iron complex transport system substrate-binding protein
MDAPVSRISGESPAVARDAVPPRPASSRPRCADGYPAGVRVISLLPSTTEILFAIGAGDDVVGVTSDCDYPAEVRSLPVVSSAALQAGLSSKEIDEQVRARMAAGEELYGLDHALVADLRPDVIVTQDLCAVCAVDVSTVDEAIAAIGCDATVVTVDPSTLEDVVRSIELLGEVVGRDREARRLVASLRGRLAAVAAAVSGPPRPRTLVLEWTDPPFAAGHWVPDMVDAAGAEPILCARGGRSVPIGWDQIEASEPEVIVVAPCGFHLDAAFRLATELRDAPQLPGDAQLWAVDADSSFVRPGPRLVDGIEALAAIAHAGTVRDRPDVARYVGTTSAKTKPSRSTISPT